MCGGKGPALSQLIQAMLPPEAASEHFRNAGIEFLKGFRELIDQRIDSLQRKPTATASSQGTKFSVD
jgi:predicted Fe-Mo cluster-binding NifX family protein